MDRNEAITKLVDYAIAEGRLGKKSYYQAKVYFHAKVRGFRDSIKRKGKKE